MAQQPPPWSCDWEMKYFQGAFRTQDSYWEAIHKPKQVTAVVDAEVYSRLRALYELASCKENWNWGEMDEAIASVADAIEQAKGTYNDKP